MQYILLKESPKTRFQLLKLLSKDKNTSIFIAYINKNKVNIKTQNKKHVLYNHMVNSLLKRIYDTKLSLIDRNVTIVASRRETNKFLNQNFYSYLKNKSNHGNKKEIEVVISSPSSEKSLQIVDIVSWAIFRKYEYADDIYYSLIKTRIIDENSVFI